MAIRAYNAALNGIGCVADLVIGEKADDLSVVCSASANTFFELAGNTDWHGYFVAYGAEPAYYPNQTFTLTFNMNQAVDEGASGSAIIEAVRVDWDFVSGAPIRYLAKFGAMGALTTGTYTTQDASTPSPKPSRDTKITLAASAAGSPDHTELTGITQASLLMYSDILPYSDSATDGIYKRAKGVVGWEMTINLHVEEVDYPTTLGTFDAGTTALNGTSEVKAYVDTTQFYFLKWVRWKKLGELHVPIQEREYVNTTYIGKGASFVSIGGTWTKGSLTSPGGTSGDIWGSGTGIWD